MKLSGQTPLSASAIPQDQLGLLRSLWVETAEEAIALTAAISGNGQVPASAAIRALSAGALATAVPQDRLDVLRQPRKGGGLGCLLDDQMLECYRRDGRLRAPRPLPTGAFEGRLPRAVRLFDRMQPVRDQGERGTCVAFAAVALREFLLAEPKDLSEQFVYWACKELDGLAESGTYIHSAMTVFAQYGVCPDSVWPYHSVPSATEGQGPPPKGVRKAAGPYRLPSARTVEPGLVLHYKHILAGEHDHDGMPVTFGTMVFNSWYMSPETHRTGKITLPLPGETPAGGHAWCVVGYVDDDTVPGGGYFIVRNSWGAKWAPDSPEAPGHALMPYAYVERFAMEAYTGPVAAPATQPPSVPDAWRDFIRVLETDARDLDGRLLKQGARVIAHPLQPEALREDTPASRQEFLRLHRAWTPEIRSRVWFPEKTEWPEAFVNDLSNIAAQKTDFLAAIHDNLKLAVGDAFPAINLPARAAFMPWSAKIRRVELEADLSADLPPLVLHASGVPAELTPPEAWADALSAVNSLRIYRLGSLTADIRVVAAFVSPLALQPGIPPAFVPPVSETIQTITDRVAQYEKTASGCSPAFTFYALASGKPWPTDQKGIAAGDHAIYLSHRTSDGDWQTLAPPGFATRVSYRNFIDRLTPLTRQQRISRIKHAVDALFDEGYQGNITVAKIAAQTGFRQTAVRDAFLAMQNVSPEQYRVKRLDRNQVSIRRARPGEPIGLTVESFRRSFFRRHGLLLVSASIGVAAWVLRAMVPAKGIPGFLVLVLLVYAAGLAQKQINSKAEENQD